MFKKIFSFALLFIFLFSNFSFVYANEEIISNTLVPDIKINFQNPSYLSDKDQNLDTYHCDTSKAECKVNFDLSESFLDFEENKFVCENNFSFITGEENKCNPNTIIFPVGTNQVKFKIIDKSNPSNFKEKIVNIINGKNNGDSQSSGEGQNSSGGTNTGEIDLGTNTGNLDLSGAIDTSSGGQDNSEELQNILEIPNIEIEIQSGLEKINDTFYCKNTDCKVNLNLENIFTGSYDISKYLCEWNFGSGSFSSSGTQNKCNPGYVNYGTGNHEIIAKVFEKNNLNNFKTGSLIFINDENGVGKSENNKDEEILNNNSGSLDGQENNPETNSGGTDNGGDSGSNFGGQNNGSGELIDDLEINTGSILEIPNIEIEIQSGLEKINDIFYCKNTDCKVNLNLENIFTGNYDISKYLCEWNFGSGTFSSSGTQNKCNPGYVNYGTGNHEIIAKVFEKNNSNNFKTGSLVFINDEGDYKSSLEGQNGSLGSQGETNKTVGIGNNNSGSLILPKIKINFQSPSYLLEKELEKSEYFCDAKKSDCKVNFDLSESFSGFIEKNYSCKINFGFNDEISDKCNPNTIIFPKGSNKVSFIIYEKNNLNNFINKEIIINNLDEIFEPKILAPIITQNEETRNIIMQSGADKIGENYYTCNKEICKVNLNFAKKSGEICKWDFGNAKFKEKYLDTCNPGYTYYGAGEHIISLKVFQENNENYKEFKIFLKNNFLEEREILPFQAKIIVQGKLSKNKELTENKLVCTDSKLCSVNFTAEFNEKLEKSKLNFFWDFGNGETFDGLNPKSINFIPGKYIVTLKVSDNYGQTEEIYFFVEVYEKGEILNFINTDIINYIKLKNAYPNPRKDEKEYITIKNNYFLPINIKGLQIDDQIGSGSKVYTFKENYYLFPFQSKKFYKEQIKINLNNSYDEVNLIYGEKNIDKLKWDFKTKKSMVLSEKNSLKYNFSINENYNNYMLKIRKSYEKEKLKEFNSLVKDLLKEKKGTKKTSPKKEKQEKIITYKTSKLKSGLKFSGKTFPNSEINLNFINQDYKTTSDNEGNYKILITNNLKIGEHKLYFQVAYNGQTYNYESPRFVEITQKYLNDLNAYKLKKSKTKTKKSSTSKTKKVSNKKLKYEVISPKQNENNNKNSNNNILVFLTSLLTGSLGFLLFRKFN